MIVQVLSCRSSADCLAIVNFVLRFSSGEVHRECVTGPLGLTFSHLISPFQTPLVKSNISVLDNMFRTPLHWAAVLGHTHMVSMLLDMNANYSCSDSNGATPLHYAAQNNHTVSLINICSSQRGLDIVTIILSQRMDPSL